MANVVDLDITAEQTGNSCINTRFSPFVHPVEFHRYADGDSSDLAGGSDSKINNSVRCEYHGDVKQFDIQSRAQHFLEQEFYLALKLHWKIVPQLFHRFIF